VTPHYHPSFFSHNCLCEKGVELGFDDTRTGMPTRLAQFAFKDLMIHVFCNSHYVSQLAAFFIDARAKRSTVKSCSWFFYFVVSLFLVVLLVFSSIGVLIRFPPPPHFLFFFFFLFEGKKMEKKMGGTGGGNAQACQEQGFGILCCFCTQALFGV
jgi:hypothetical protein